MLPLHTNYIEMECLGLILGWIKAQTPTPLQAAHMIFVAPLLAIRFTRVCNAKGCYILGRRGSVPFSLTNWDLKD